MTKVPRASSLDAKPTAVRDVEIAKPDDARFTCGHGAPESRRFVSAGRMAYVARRCRGRGRGGRHGGRGGERGEWRRQSRANQTKPPCRAAAVAGAPVHPWLGRRLRITRISHKGQRRYVNAAIVFHDPAESHPFHVLHDDGASAWLAIQEKRGIVHAVEGDGGNQGLRTRVSRRFTWLTPVVRRETAVVERTQAFGAPSSEHVSHLLNSHARERDLFLAAARGAANRSEPYGHQSRVFPSVLEFRVSARGNFERVFGASSGFALRSVLASSRAREACAGGTAGPRERVANVGGGCVSRRRRSGRPGTAYWRSPARRRHSSRRRR